MELLGNSGKSERRNLSIPAQKSAVTCQTPHAKTSSSSLYPAIKNFTFPLQRATPHTSSDFFRNFWQFPLLSSQKSAGEHFGNHIPDVFRKIFYFSERLHAKGGRWTCRESHSRNEVGRYTPYFLHTYYRLYLYCIWKILPYFPNTPWNPVPLVVGKTLYHSFSQYAHSSSDCFAKSIYI